MAAKEIKSELKSARDAIQNKDFQTALKHCKVCILPFASSLKITRSWKIYTEINKNYYYLTTVVVLFKVLFSARLESLQNAPRDFDRYFGCYRSKSARRRNPPRTTNFLVWVQCSAVNCLLTTVNTH